MCGNKYPNRLLRLRGKHGHKYGYGGDAILKTSDHVRLKATEFLVFTLPKASRANMSALIDEKTTYMLYFIYIIHVLCSLTFNGISKFSL